MLPPRMSIMVRGGMECHHWMENTIMRKTTILWFIYYFGYLQKLSYYWAFINDTLIFLDWWSSNDGPISYWVRVSAVKALLTSNASIFRMCPHRGKSGWACSFFGTIRSVSQFFQEIRFLRNMSRSVPRNFRNWILRFSVIPVWFRF